ncbi:ATP-binding protein [Variovorax sp. M-6]|uniref:ATP-binding protein n=1 Tax=Variovorax sp. M-6 TaxID=3233041 RepID=UPI003F9BAB1E
MTYQYITQKAIYEPTGVSLYDGNPLIEALHPMEPDKIQIVHRIAHTPPPFSRVLRKKAEMQRLAELAHLDFFVYPFAEYKNVGEKLTTMIRDPYITRNPLLPTGRQHDYFLHSLGINASELNSFQQKSRAIIVSAVTGSGKTTFASRFLAPYLKVIEHTEYKSRPFKRRQVPVVCLSTPHDGTLKSLCLQFFQTVDDILENTHYVKLAKAVSSIAGMAQLIHQVSSTISLAMIFVDDLQHLRAATGKNADIVLNFFSQLVERAGVSLFVCGTPALVPVLKKSVANTRKLGRLGDYPFPQMRRSDPQFIAFCEAQWKFLLVRNPVNIDNDILGAWWECGGGNPAFTTMAFTLAQRKAIGGNEQVDARSFERVAENEMGILSEAIKALKAGGRSLYKFEDLLFAVDPIMLRRLAGLPEAEDDESAETDEEFGEVEQALQEGDPDKHEAPRRKTSKATGAGSSSYKDLPTITPRF